MRNFTMDPMARAGGPRAAVRRGFSLVEVLIAVFVLSLGMLGLASIFPVVLQQQRRAGETTEGSIALGSIEAALRSNLDLNVTGQNKGWGILQDDASQTSGWSKIGQWEVPTHVAANDPPPESRLGIDIVTSQLRIHSDDPNGAGADPFGDDILIPLSARLGPGAFLRGANPRVEWVFAARRIITQMDAQNDPLPTDQDELEIVVFVRPIDRAIQVPRRDRTNRALWAAYGRSITLSDVLLANEIAANNGTPSIQASEARLPVGQSVQTDLPTNNGTGYYAAPYTVPMADYVFEDPSSPTPATDDDRDRLILEADPDDPAGLLSGQIGQRLVDVHGNVYTVRGRRSAGSQTIVTIDPPVPASITNSLDLGDLVASPIVPVAVEIFRVRP